MNFVLTRYGSEHVHRGTRHVRVYCHLCTMFVHSMVLKCLPLKDRGDYTHKQLNNAGYSNGSSLPVEGLEIIDVYYTHACWYSSIIIMRVAVYFSHQ